MKVYYAHPMCMYGTMLEKLIVAKISKKFKSKITNPAAFNNHPEKRRNTMSFCKRLIDECDIVVFNKLGGEITCGVGVEINYGLDKGKAVYELTKNGFVPVTEYIKYLSYHETIQLYRKFR